MRQRMRNVRNARPLGPRGHLDLAAAIAFTKFPACSHRVGVFHAIAALILPRCPSPVRDGASLIFAQGCLARYRACSRRSAALTSSTDPMESWEGSEPLAAPHLAG